MKNKYLALNYIPHMNSKFWLNSIIILLQSHKGFQIK